jgi:TatD DNase family protein
LFINVHCHNNQTPVNEWVIKNIFQDFGNLPESGFFSAGIHPCYIPSQNLEAQFMVLEECIADPWVLAIGECGLDKLSAFPMEVQLPVFLKQIELASNSKKPLIIHCVKAYEEIMHTLNITAFHLPVLFHGFRKNIHLAKALTHKGYYLSFGAALQYPSVQEVFAGLPMEYLLLETDDAQIPILQIYQWATEATGLPQESVILQMQNNASKFFNHAIP